MLRSQPHEEAEPTPAAKGSVFCNLEILLPAIAHRSRQQCYADS